MTKARTPATFAFALTRVVGLLTVAEAARIVRRSERTIYAWMDPTGTKAPTIDQALALDAAYIAAGGDGAPIHETYAARLDLAVTDQLSCNIAFAQDVAKAAKEAGDAISSSLAVTLPGAGPREIYDAMGEVEEAQSRMAVLRRHLTNFLKRGAGPRREATGGVP